MKEYLKRILYALIGKPLPTDPPGPTPSGGGGPGAPV